MSGRMRRGKGIVKNNFFCVEILFFMQALLFIIYWFNVSTVYCYQPNIGLVMGLRLLPVYSWCLWCCK